MQIFRKGFYQALASSLVRARPTDGLVARMKLLHQCADADPGEALCLLKGWKTEPRTFDAVKDIAGEFTAIQVTHGEQQPSGYVRFGFENCEIVSVPANFYDLLKRAVHVSLKINSFGGSAPAALHMVRALRKSGLPVEVTITGVAYSAAADLAMAGTRRRIVRDGKIVLHLPSSIVHADAAGLRREAEKLEKLQAEFEDIYTRATGQPAAIVREWFTPGTDAHFTAEQALVAGLVHEIV
jgi:ATP-dependent protease ClpP protease subunit